MQVSNCSQAAIRVRCPGFLRLRKFWYLSDSKGCALNDMHDQHRQGRTMQVCCGSTSPSSGGIRISDAHHKIVDSNTILLRSQKIDRLSYLRDMVSDRVDHLGRVLFERGYAGAEVPKRKKREKRLLVHVGEARRVTISRNVFSGRRASGLTGSRQTRFGACFR